MPPGAVASDKDGEGRNGKGHRTYAVALPGEVYF